MTKYIWFVLAIALCTAPSASAQSSFGYAFLGGTFGDRGLGGAFRYGIGGELHAAPLVTLGAEIGGLSKNGSGVLGSGNVSVHIPLRSAADPFVTGGVSFARKHGEMGLYANFGGGVNYWLRQHLGVRAEFRDYPGGYDLSSFAEFRIGVVFR